MIFFHVIKTCQEVRQSWGQTTRTWEIYENVFEDPFLTTEEFKTASTLRSITKLISNDNTITPDSIDA